MPAQFLALGDSYTIGEGVAAQERWPAQLVARLHGQGIAVDEPRIIARTGWTTGELSAAMDESGFDPPYDLVTLLIGVNNQYRGLPLDEYRGQFRALLARAVALAGDDPERVLVVSIPDWGITRFARADKRDAGAIAKQIDAFNHAARGIAQSASTRWADVTGISRDPHHRESLVADGLHPDGAQYARWVDAIAPVAATILRR